MIISQPSEKSGTRAEERKKIKRTRAEYASGTMFFALR